MSQLKSLKPAARSSQRRPRSEKLKLRGMPGCILLKNVRKSRMMRNITLLFLAIGKENKSRLPLNYLRFKKSSLRRRFMPMKISLKA